MGTFLISSSSMSILDSHCVKTLKRAINVYVSSIIYSYSLGSCCLLVWGNVVRSTREIIIIILLLLLHLLGLEQKKTWLGNSIETRGALENVTTGIRQAQFTVRNLKRIIWLIQTSRPVIICTLGNWYGSRRVDYIRSNQRNMRVKLACIV